MGTMIWLRRLFVGILSLVMLVALLGTASSFSIINTFNKPAKVESWLNQSGIYNDLLNKTVKQAETSINSDGQGTNDNTEIVKAAQAAYPTTAFQKDLNSFITSNYNWLQGKAATPNFKIDLTGAKQNFASSFSQYTQSQLLNLPSCTLKQSEELSTTNPLALTCLPEGTSVASLQQQIDTEIANSGAFLNNPVITADTINQNNNNQGQPYYQRYSKAPQVYQQSQKIPLVLAAIALVCVIIVFFIADRKRHGLRDISIILLLSGLLILGASLSADSITKKVDKKLITKSSGSIEPALLNFSHYAEHAISKLNKDFAIGYIALAVIILLILLIARLRSRSSSGLRPDKKDKKAARKQTKRRPDAPSLNPIDTPSAPPRDNYRLPEYHQPRPHSQTREPDNTVSTAPPLPQQEKQRRKLIQ